MASIKGRALGGALLAAGLAAAPARADGPHVLVTGRWDNTLIVVDLARAADPRNDGTPNAVVNRLRVTPDIVVDGAAVPAAGQPVNVVVGPNRDVAYVVNHSGRVPAAVSRAFQHGHPGTVTVVDLARALDPAANGTLAAVRAVHDTGGAGPVGFAATPDGRHGFVAHAERHGDEDGGNLVTVLDLATGAVVGRVELALGSPGFPCPPATVPHAAPHPDFGCFPDTNGLAYSPVGGGTLIGGNGGTDDVSIIDVRRAIAGEPGAELARVPIDTGAFGVAISPDGRLAAVAARESARTGAEGSTVSIIDIARAREGAAGAEVARVRIGTDDPANRPARTFSAAFTPDGRRLLVSGFRSNTLSVVDVARALARDPGAEETRLVLETPDGRPSRPRGIAITADGTRAAVTGAPRSGPGSSVLWVVDLERMAVLGRVTEVGDEAYMVDALPAR